MTVSKNIKWPSRTQVDATNAFYMSSTQYMTQDMGYQIVASQKLTTLHKTHLNFALRQKNIFPLDTNEIPRYGIFPDILKYPELM